MKEKDIRFLKESFQFVGDNWKFFIISAILLAIPFVNVIALIILSGYMLEFLPNYIKKGKHTLPKFNFMNALINGIMIIVIGLIYFVVFTLLALLYALSLFVVFGGLYALTSLSIFPILGFAFFFVGFVIGVVVLIGMYSLAIAKYAVTEDLSMALKIRETYNQTKNKQFWFLFIRFSLFVFFVSLLVWFIVYLPAFISTSHIDFNNVPLMSVVLEYVLMSGLFGAYKLMLSYLVYGKLYNLRNKKA